MEGSTSKCEESIKLLESKFHDEIKDDKLVIIGFYIRLNQYMIP